MDSSSRLAFHRTRDKFNRLLEVDLPIERLKAIHWALVNRVGDAAYAKIIGGLGHTQRLNIVKLIAKTWHNPHFFDDGSKERIASAETIDKNRNLYMHTLQLPNNIGKISLMRQRQLETLFHGFLDMYAQNQFLMRLQHIAEDTGVARSIVVCAIQKISGQSVSP